VSADLALPLYVRDKVALTTEEREQVKAAKLAAEAPTPFTMNAILKPLEAQFEAMTPAWLDAVVRVEQTCLRPSLDAKATSPTRSMPATRRSCSPAGNPPDAELLGYFVAMKGVDEVHLLNITVAPEHQRQGWARIMLDALAIWSRGQGAQWLWLEVRVSNVRAKAVYERYGFRHVGTRRNYYPGDGSAAREDAVVMSLAL
jgi:ribosomal-protein-alanine N-acetyltransferase